MGQDAVFVHLFEKYFAQKEYSWLTQQGRKMITDRAYSLMANIMGTPAAEVELPDSTGAMRSLYKDSSAYSIVMFWDPTCGHCKEELPHIDSIYRASWKQHGVKIYAALSADSKDELKNDWIKYTKEHNLQDWINVYQTKETEAAIQSAQKAGYRQLYDVTMTPTLYLLDKEKRIIGKKLTWKQIDELLQVKWSGTPAPDSTNK